MMMNDLPPVLATPEAAHDAYNAAFYERGLRWHWDRETYSALLSHSPDPQGASATTSGRRAPAPRTGSLRCSRQPAGNRRRVPPRLATGLAFISLPREITQLPTDEQAKVLARLKQTTCFGIQSGVTTALVKAEKLCQKVDDVPARVGLGQSYLPTKAAFEWRPDRWVGVITRAQSARSASMGKLVGPDSKIRHARLIVIPTKQSSWGYGIYIRQDVPADIAARTLAQFAGLKQPSPSLARSLDVGATFQFASLKGSEIDAMRSALDM